MRLNRCNSRFALPLDSLMLQVGLKVYPQQNEHTVCPQQNEHTDDLHEQLRA